MICPHCRASLLRKERPNRICGKCGRPYALDPKVHGRGMHDTRIRRVVEKATDGGRRNVTVTQLWYLARTGNPVREASPDNSIAPWTAHSFGAALLAGLVLLGFLVHSRPYTGIVLVLAAAVSIFLYGAALAARNLPGTPAQAFVLPSHRNFQSMICGDWVQAYGHLPPGIVDDGAGRAAPPHTGQPRSGTLEVLCPDPAVRVFLVANDFPARLDLTLAAGLGELAGTGPVLVLHDAGLRGLQLVADARAQEPRRVVVDAGVPLRVVVGNTKAVRLHEDPPEDVQEDPPQWLRELAPAAPDHADWLMEGWFSPLAAVPPAALESTLARAVREARGAAGREQREAVAAGFLSWPQSPEAAAEDGN
ncbi:hypothetical protein ACFZAU_38260 [Streptomyces sp. NPDC008238]